LWLVDLSWLHARLTESFRTQKNGHKTGAAGLTLRAMWAGAFLVIIAHHAVQAAKWVRESYSEGLGYANVSWHDSEMLAYLRRLPSEQAVLSNAFDAIYVLTGRETYPFPRRSGDAAIPTGLTAAEEWRQTTGLMEEEGALLAAFRMATRRGHVDVSEIAEATTLCVIGRCGSCGCNRRRVTGHGNSPLVMQGFGPRRSSSTNPS
jgi:hypothetical protein